MSKIVGFLFPLKRTFRRMELEKRWWHRLAVVLFFVALILSFLYSWVIGYSIDEPEHTFIQEIHHWRAGSNGLLFDVDSFQPFDATAPPTPPPPTVQKSIEMPDGKTATFPGNTSDDAIKAEWTRKSHRAAAEALLFGFSIAILLTLVFDYFLQACYRALLYVIYGANTRAVNTISS